MSAPEISMLTPHLDAWDAPFEAEDAATSPGAAEGPQTSRARRWRRGLLAAAKGRWPRWRIRGRALAFPF